MKLELKHLTPYLPYGLKICNRGEYSNDENKILQQFEMVGLGCFVEYHEIGRTVNEENYYEDVFPILRPLSDITRKELENAGFECHIDYLTDENKGSEWTKKAPYTHVDYLISKHFDVFGLIDKELAIDINNLKQ